MMHQVQIEVVVYTGQVQVHEQRQMFNEHCSWVWPKPDWEGHCGVGGSITDPSSAPNQGGELVYALRQRKS